MYTRDVTTLFYIFWFDSQRVNRLFTVIRRKGRVHSYLLHLAGSEQGPFSLRHLATSVAWFYESLTWWLLYTYGHWKWTSKNSRSWLRLRITHAAVCLSPANWPTCLLVPVRFCVRWVLVLVLRFTEVLSFMNSYYLYDISHPNKYGVPLRSLDEDLSIDGSVVEHLTYL